MSNTPTEAKAGNTAVPPERYAILFTDLVGSSILTERLGNDDYKTQVLQPLLTIQRDAIQKHNGKTVGGPAGDSLMAVFRKTDDALQAALDLLQQTRIWNDTEGKRLGYEVWERTGVHFSTETLHWDETNLLAGHGDLNYAARLMGLADGGQIVVSEQARESRGVGAYDWRTWPYRRIKSFEDRPVNVFTVGWDHPNAHKEPGSARIPDWIREENRYIARTELENRIVDCFKRQSDMRPPFRLVTLHGFGGAGKTRLALQCCLLMLPIFESRVRYVRLDLLPVTEQTDDPTRRDLLAEAIATAYGLKGDPARPENLPQSLPAEMNLLLLDNYETVACKVSSKLVTRLIEKNRALHILVTGRRGVLNANLEKTLEIQPLDRETARELFLDRVRMKPNRDTWTPSPLDETAIEEILTLTAGLPLALVLVAARADKSSLHELAEGLKKTALGRETTLPPNHLYDADTTRHDSLQLCLDWSWALLDAGERRSLCCLSLFADDFTGDDVSACFPATGEEQPGVTAEETERLQDAALLNREERAATGESIYSMLRPTKEYAEAKQATAPGIDQATASFIARYRRLMETHVDGARARKPQTMAALDPLYRNAGAALDYAVKRENLEDVSALYNTMWRYLDHRAFYAEQIIVETSVLALRERVLGPEHRATLMSVNNLAALLESKGDYTAAEPLFRRALEVSERVLGPEHPATLTSVNNLAYLLESKGDYTAAELLYRRALEATERVLGPDHPDTLISVNNLAGLLESEGDYTAAELLYRRALETRERVLGPEHPDTLRSLNNLASLLESKGEEAAESLYRRALEARERVLGPEHPDTLISVNNLAALLYNKGNYAAAEPLFRRTLEASERVLGPEHPDTLRSLNNLASLLESKGEEAAESLYRRALEARERVLGPEHPDTLISVNNLAALLYNKGNYAAAEPLFRRTLEASERVLGPEHPDTLRSLNNLASLLESKGEEAAESLYRRALEARERVLGPEHPDTLISVNNLAALLYNKGNYAAAEPLFRRTLEASERVLGPEHPDTLTTLRSLQDLLVSTGRPDEAAALRRE